MNEEEIRRNLPLYADGALDAEVTREIDRRLASSGELSEEVERWRGLRQAVHRVVGAAPVPVGLEERVRTALRTAGASDNSRILRLFGGITAIAAAIVISVVLWYPRSEVVAAPSVAAVDFAKIYRKCAVTHRHRAFAVDWTDRCAVQNTLDSRLKCAVLVPDLREKGYELDGACDCFRVDGVQGIHVFYRRGNRERSADGSDVVSVFTVAKSVRLQNCERRGDCGKHRVFELADAGPVVVCKWDDHARSYAVCSEMEPDALRDLAEHVRDVQRPRLAVKVVEADEGLRLVRR
jgi:anti-sigma factor RsiW